LPRHPRTILFPYTTLFRSGPQNPTSGSINARRTHLISDGDTLQSIANEEYGNPNFWRGVAIFNAIDDPLRLTKGDRILLPSTDEDRKSTRLNSSHQIISYA